MTNLHILNYFEKIKEEYVKKSRPVLRDVLKGFSLDFSIQDPIGRTLTFFNNVNEFLDKSCMKYVWTSEHSR